VEQKKGAGKIEIREATGHTISKPRQRINPGMEGLWICPHDRAYIARSVRLPG
jgi:hypothetical protein